MEWRWKFTFLWGSVLLSLRITHLAANVALGGAAAQSSLPDPLYPPSLVVDGKPHSDYSYHSCVSTLKENDPWWRVDMGMTYDIATIVVIRRSDCCASKLAKAEIRIGDSLVENGNKNKRCAVIDVNSEVIMTFHCDTHRGRYVNIFLPGKNKMLQLCEVEVYPANQFTRANVALGGEPAMSTVLLPEWPPSKGIDGDNSTIFLDWGCTSTERQTDPWWRVDLRGPYNVLSVVVTRRTDGFIDLIDGAEVRIGNSLENNGNNNPRCGVLRFIATNPNMKLSCHMEGRYVNVFLPGELKTIQICEVEVFATTTTTGDEVAKRGIATQSAEPASAETGPGKAKDNFPGYSALETCASVPKEDNPWWRLDLGSIYRVTAVSIIRTRDNHPEELNGAEVRIGLRNDTSNQRCAVISVAKGQLKYNYHCGAMDGRFVHVVLPGLQKTLTVCEVLVYGTVLENVALRGVAFQSSSRFKDRWEASRVIDGKRFLNCSTTEDKPAQWVTVDLLVPYNVTAVQLAFSNDSCGSNDVRVDNTSCAVIPGSSRIGTKCLMTLDCGGIVGRYVTVMHPDIPPTLCEMEVFSTWEHLNNPTHQDPPSHGTCSSCSHDYILIHSESKTWSEAQAYCREKYTDLATITDSLDMNRVVDKMANVFNNFWIGLYEDVVTWRWSLSDEQYYADGGAEFRNWGVGEPNDESGVQRCAAIQHTGDWKILGCDVLNYFLCSDHRKGAPEKEILVETAMNWSDAQGYCRKRHTDLLSVRKQAENQEIQSMVPEGKQAWIGLFQDSWTWSDGSYSSFRYWSQTLNSTGEGPLCAHVYNRTWSVRPCSTTSMFLCSYRLEEKKSVFRITSDVDMSDAAIQQQILSQLEARMRKKGIGDFNIHWTKSWKEQTEKCAPPEGRKTGEACSLLV